MRDGKKVEEREVKNYSKHDWVPSDECDVSDFGAVYEVCNRLYDARQITKCCVLMEEAYVCGAENDARLRRIWDVVYAGALERVQSQVTMYEYLPMEMKDTLEHLCESFEQLRQRVPP